MKNELLKTDKDRKQFKKWIRALRRGKYQQGRGYLQTARGYCCLGVACKVLIRDKDVVQGDKGRLLGTSPENQPHSPEWLKDVDYDFYSRAYESLATLNDCGDFTFDEIADLLEAVYIHRVLD